MARRSGRPRRDANGSCGGACGAASVFSYDRRAVAVPRRDGPGARRPRRQEPGQASQGVELPRVRRAGADGRQRGDAGRGRVAVAGHGRREVDGHVPRGGVDARGVERRVRRAARVDRVPRHGRCRRRCSSSIAAILGGRAVVLGCARDPGHGAGRGRRSRRRCRRGPSRRTATPPFAVVMRIVVFPLFLFSGTFFPVTSRCPTARAGVVPVAAVARRRAVPGRDHRRRCRQLDTTVGRGARGRAGRLDRRRLAGGAPRTFDRTLDAMTASRGTRAARRRAHADARAGSCPGGSGGARCGSSSATASRTGASGTCSSPGSSSRRSTCCRSGSAWVGSSGTVPGPGGEPIELQGVRGARVDGRGGDERRGARHHVQLLLQVQVRAHLRRDARHAAAGARRRAWARSRGRCCAARVYSTAFLVTMVLFGLVGSWWAVLAVPAGLLIAFAFAGAGIAGTTFMRSWIDFDFVNLALIPMFLFSATFFPLSQYPDAVADGRAGARRCTRASCSSAPSCSARSTGSCSCTPPTSSSWAGVGMPHRHPPPLPPPPALDSTDPPSNWRQLRRGYTDL